MDIGMDIYRKGKQIQVGGDVYIYNHISISMISTVFNKYKCYIVLSAVST
jgi:hypothetical protein